MILAAVTGGTTTESVSLLTETITALVEGFTTWIGEGVEVIVNHPLLLGLFLIGFMSVGIAAIRRFF